MSTSVTEAPPSQHAPAAAHGALEDHQHGGPVELFRHTMVFARRNAEHIRQIPEKLIEVTVQPLMFVLLFAFVFGGAIDVKGSNYREYLIGGILIQSLAFGMMGPATAIATDLNEGVIDRFRSLPATRTAYLLGHFVAELGGMVLAIAVLTGTGYIVGWRTHTDALHVAAAFALLLVFASSMIWVGTCLGMLVRSPDAVQGVAFVVVFPLTFLSNAFVPIESMPNALQYVAAWNPVSVLVAAVRELFGNRATPITKDVWPLHHPVVASWLACLVILTVAVPGTLHRYRTRTSD
jgi:ABC-2 type transport system permease protein